MGTYANSEDPGEMQHTAPALFVYLAFRDRKTSHVI